MTASNEIYVPSHLIGLETKNSFNGTWGTDAKWHKIFYKDIKAHEMFTGTFEAEKTIKFHENPVPDKIQRPVMASTARETWQQTSFLSA